MGEIKATALREVKKESEVLMLYCWAGEGGSVVEAGKAGCVQSEGGAWSRVFHLRSAASDSAAARIAPSF